MCASSARPHRTAYDPFAWIYNRSMAEDFCRRAMPILDSLLLTRLLPGARILDLCCGSGQMARVLCERGFQVAGIDSSEHMLALARENAPDLALILCDARHFSFHPAFDVVLSTFNSLAHTASTHDLDLVFHNVRSALTATGSFLFDLTMEDGYAAKWHGSFSEVHDGVAWTVRPSYDITSKLAINDVTVFRRERQDTWRRSDFRITQKCHAEYEIRNALQAAGFRHVDSYDAETDLGMAGECGRRFFVAR